MKDGVLRELRQQRGLTQTQVARKARLSGNTVSNAENGRPVSKRTVREIIRVLDANAELLCIDLERGLYTISKHSPAPIGHDVLSFISDELNGATSTEEFKAKLEMLLKLAGVKEAFLSELFAGSLHWSMSLTKVEADKLCSMFDANRNVADY